MRSIWKGAISFGLVSIPVQLFAATAARGVSLHQVHAQDGGRIRYRRICAVDGEEVPYSDVAKGYELPNGDVVVLDDEDFADLPLSSSRTIDVLSFVEANTVDPIQLSRCYYCEPIGTAVKPYILLREALERRGKLHALITQNIDELHQLAGNSAERVIEVHGTMRKAVCMSCGWRGPMQETLERVRAGEEDPPCKLCGGILKGATISFGQALVPEVIDRALRVAGEADVFVAVGTSLQVYPVAGAVPMAKSAGARIIILNAQETPFDDVADAVLQGSISEILPRICGTG